MERCAEHNKPKEPRMKVKILTVIAVIVFMASLSFNFYVLFQSTHGYSLQQRKIGFDLCSKQVDKLVEEGKIEIVGEK